MVFRRFSEAIANRASRYLGGDQEALYESGMTFIVLQPTMFMQTLDTGWNEVLEHQRFSLPYSKHAKASCCVCRR